MDNTSYTPLSVRGQTPSQMKEDTETFETSRWGKWSAPATMVPGLLVGVGFAIGHHLFYWSLDGTEAGNIKRQQWSLQIGSFFATAFGTVIRLTVGTAYLQYLWLRLKHTPVSLKGVDHAFQAMTDIRVLLRHSFGSVLPGAYFAVLVFWSTHVAVLFPPATLSTKETEAPGSINVPVPSLMYINTSTIYPDDPRPSFGLREQLPDEEEVSRYVKDTQWLSDLLDQVLREKEPTVPTILEQAINYNYELMAPLPWLQCEQINTTALQAFKSQIEDALYSTMVRDVLDLPIDGEDMTVLMNVTLNEDWDRYLIFSYQTATESPLPNGGYDIHNVSNIRYGEINYLAWPGTVDLQGTPQNFSNFFSLGWSSLLDTKDGEPSRLLDGSLYLVSRNESGTNNVFIKCEVHNATVDLDVTIDDREASIIGYAKDIRTPLSANKALWSGDGDSDHAKWVALALSAWMSPLYRNIWGMELYIAETDSNHSTRQDAPLIVPETLTNGYYVDIIEKAAHNYALSLMSGSDDDSRGYGWFKGQIESRFMGMHLIYTYKARNLIISYAVISLSAAIVVIVGMWSFVRNDRVSFDEKPTTLASAMRSTTMEKIFQYNPVGSAVNRKRVENHKVVLKPESAGLDQKGKTVLAYKFKKC
ncbi:hypothetical protein F5Y08DRAFT_350448 [Xylaria arbuscula]|nr:hypothetical protein F5Y08DRAFT_350448 [Xylaria arbuscula]